MREYANEHGFKMNLTTPENPQSNGFAEIFVKVLCKLLHTASAEGKDPRKELNKEGVNPPSGGIFFSGGQKTYLI